MQNKISNLKTNLQATILLPTSTNLGVLQCSAISAEKFVKYLKTVAKMDT